MGYLGLALLEAGDAARARGWFAKAGSEQLVARCDELLAGGHPSAAQPARTSPPEPPAAELTEPPVPEPLGTPLPASLPAVRPAPAALAAASAVPPAGVTGAATLASYAAERVMPECADGFAAVAQGVLSVAVGGEVRVRLEGLLAVAGRIAIAPERKRFRGRPTEQAFGEGAATMHRVSGEGTLLFRAAGRRFTALALGPEAAYLREPVVFGFDEGVTFENGRVQSTTSAELDLVLLRGRGRLLLVTAGELVALDVAPDAPLRVSLAALVGWTGALTPRLTAFLEDGDDARRGGGAVGRGAGARRSGAVAIRPAAA